MRGLYYWTMFGSGMAGWAKAFASTCTSDAVRQAHFGGAGAEIPPEYTELNREHWTAVLVMNKNADLTVLGELDNAIVYWENRVDDGVSRMVVFAHPPGDLTTAGQAMSVYKWSARRATRVRLVMDGKVVPYEKIPDYCQSCKNYDKMVIGDCWAPGIQCTRYHFSDVVTMKLPDPELFIPYTRCSMSGWTEPVKRSADTLLLNVHPENAPTPDQLGQPVDTNTEGAATTRMYRKHVCSHCMFNERGHGSCMFRLKSYELPDCHGPYFEGMLPEVPPWERALLWCMQDSTSVKKADFLAAYNDPNIKMSGPRPRRWRNYPTIQLGQVYENGDGSWDATLFAQRFGSRLDDFYSWSMSLETALRLAFPNHDFSTGIPYLAEASAADAPKQHPFEQLLWLAVKNNAFALTIPRGFLNDRLPWSGLERNTSSWRDHPITAITVVYSTKTTSLDACANSLSDLCETHPRILTELPDYGSLWPLVAERKKSKLQAEILRRKQQAAGPGAPAMSAVEETQTTLA